MLVGLPVDVCFGSIYDLTRVETQRAILTLIRSGICWYVHFGTPCCVWSIARTKVTNLERAREKERLGLEFALFTALCCSEIIRAKCFFSIENPSTSRLWCFQPIADLLSRSGVFIIDFTMCAYGRPYRKCTRLLTNCPVLEKLRRSCPGLSRAHRHIPLAGSIRVRIGGRLRHVSATAWAGQYPLALCRRWAALLLEIAPKESLASYGRGASSLVDPVESQRLALERAVSLCRSRRARAGQQSGGVASGPSRAVSTSGAGARRSSLSLPVAGTASGGGSQLLRPRAATCRRLSAPRRLPA